MGLEHAGGAGLRASSEGVIYLVVWEATTPPEVIEVDPKTIAYIEWRTSGEQNLERMSRIANQRMSDMEFDDTL